jgi:hypothetical protein
MDPELDITYIHITFSIIMVVSALERLVLAVFFGRARSLLHGRPISIYNRFLGFAWAKCVQAFWSLVFGTGWCPEVLALLY